MYRLILLITVLAIPAVCYADTIHVPADHPTIQAGIDAAVNGDIVLVAPDTYYENIDFLGKPITLRSSDGPEETVIWGMESYGAELGSVVYFKNGEGPDSVLDGFTVRNGLGTKLWKSFYEPFGGGVFCRNSSPTILNNTIKFNKGYYGGGIACLDYASPLISNNKIINNQGHGGSWCDGGGIFCYNDSEPTISNNIIANNQATCG